MRIAKLSLSLGAVLLVISFLGIPPDIENIQVSNEMYYGFIFRGVTDIFIESELITREGNYSLYVLDADDTVTAVANGNLTHARPLLKLIDIQNFTGIVTLPSPGVYSVLITTISQEEIEVWIKVSAVIPIIGIFLAAIILCIIGVIFLFIPEIIRVLNYRTQLSIRN
jgi:hypothetical protein